MPGANEEVAPVGESSGARHQLLADQDFTYIDEDEKHPVAATSQDTESRQLRQPTAVPVNKSQGQAPLNQTATGNRHSSPMGTPAEANHCKAIASAIEDNKTNGGGTVKRAIHHPNDSETHPNQQQQSQQQIQRVSNNNKPERNVNGGGRLNGCCCRRPASSSEECVDDDQADNYCQRSKNNNNNIKMTITLTATTVSSSSSSVPSPLKNEWCGPLPATAGAPAAEETMRTTTATAATVTTLTSATTANAIEMASATVTTATTTSTTTATATTVTATIASAPLSSQRVMNGCGPSDNSNESDANRTPCEGSPTQRQLADSRCNDSAGSSVSNRKCNDGCNNDNTMTRSAINTPSMQSPSLSSSPSPSPSSSPSSSSPLPTSSSSSSASSAAPPASEALRAPTSQDTPTLLLSPSQSATAAATVAPAAVSSPSPSPSPSPSTGHKVLTQPGNKSEFKATASGGSEFIGRTASNGGLPRRAAALSDSVATATCNGVVDDADTSTGVTRNMMLRGKDRVCSTSQRNDDLAAKCGGGKDAVCGDDGKYYLNCIALDELDDTEDPYNVLQEYLERVKNEINEVFEQYRAKQSDESTRCPVSDTANVAADNKLPSNETSCRLNGSTDSSQKVNETSNSRDINGGSSTRNGNSQSSSISDSSSNSGRYLTVPVPVDSSSEYQTAPVTPTIMSTNTFPSLNHGKDHTEDEQSSRPSTSSSNSSSSSTSSSSSSSTSNGRTSTLKRLNSHNDYLSRTALRSRSALDYPHHGYGNSSGGSGSGSGSGSCASSDDVNIWANKFLRELDNLMGSDKWSSASSTITTATMTNGSGGAPVMISIPRPEKHVTIPLQSFNLDCRRPDVPTTTARHLLSPHGGGIYLRTLSAPNGNDSNHSLGNCRLLPKNTPSSGSTVLKIEENDATIRDRCRRQVESEIETMRALLNQSQPPAGPAATPKRERVHQVIPTGNGHSNGGSYLLHNDTTKKGSTSTIWTSEESILRSGGAADEDNNSTSSSACEEASGVLSSGKSGISLDSSGLDNDNNESGIGTATPPKEAGFWKNTADNDSLTSSLDPLRKIKFQKGSSVASSDDPDLLEVLSLYDEAHDDDVDDIEIHNDDEHDHDHEEYETGTFDGYDGIDCESHRHSSKGVVLRKKSNLQINDGHGGSKDSAIHMLPYTRAHKCRSHSLDIASPLPPPVPFRVELKAKEYKDKGRLCLALRQEPFQSILPTNFHELPSPSSASLHSGHESLGMQELTTKSNSAPLLLKKERKRDDFGGQKQTLRYSRSQSDRYLAEIEAVEACKWLRAAGFPQYAQMYEDHQFPIDLTNVAKDHTNLENDPLQSLYRRLCILNRCANMRLDSSHKSHTPQKEDSDDENCALSENWTFQPHIRRWSRIGEMGLELPTKLSQDKTESSSKESSPDRFEDDDTYDISGAALNLSLSHEQSEAVNNDSDSSAVRLRRTGSERLKDGAKALLRRVESIKSRRRKRQNREGIVISGPQALDLSQLGQRGVRKPDAVYSTPPSPSAVSPMHLYPKSPLFHHPGQHELKVPSQSENFLSPNRMSSPKRTPTTPRSMRTSPLHFFATSPMPHLKEGRSDDSSSYYSDSQESSSTGGGKLTLSLRKAPSKSRRFLQRTGKVDDIGAHSDSECHQGRKFVFKDGNSSTTGMKVKKLTRGGSLNLGKDPKKREGLRSASFRTRSTVRKDHKNSESDTENIKVSKSPVVRWHSFQEEERPHMIFKKCVTRKVEVEKTEGTPFAAMSCGQLQIIRKLALAILTGYMERYCPTHRSGWNWELPKFIKKIKMPDYKDKKVFGVPLLLILQRTGQTLPVAVRSAFRWLQLNALDQIGLFRKSGVKSRIFKLKERIELAESSAECMDVFDTQQAYDVADMLKQYFRDLPESLLTTKMSETFAAIFQHLPPDVRLDAVQCAVLLLPDENREILYALLEFLTLVSDNSQYNQMTANNLAVCLAPSLFHTSISTGSSSVSASPRRRKTTGVPDVKELSEAKASHECLSFMIDNYRQIFTASRERISKCNFGYMEESRPVPLEALGEGMQFHNWRGYLYECTSATIKEGREKSRGWFTITSLDTNVDIAYKKVGDGHPLRLWRCVTEVEGPPKDVLDYVLKHRASWDINLLQSQTIEKLDERTEIFQYVFDGQMCTDFCVLRSWQTDLPRGACVIVETSIEHPKAKPIFGSIRGVVLASRYLIEPCGSGRSRVMHLARVDIKGKTPEWYNKSYGHICSHYLSKIKAAFRHVADGPESKV